MKTPSLAFLSCIWLGTTGFSEAVADSLTTTTFKLLYQSLEKNVSPTSQRLINTVSQETGESVEAIRTQWHNALDALAKSRRKKAPSWNQTLSQAKNLEPRQADKFLQSLIEESTKLLGKKGDYPLDPIIEKAARKAKILPFQGKDYLLTVLARELGLDVQELQPAPQPKNPARHAQEQAGKFLLDGRSSYAYDLEVVRNTLTGEQGRNSNLGQFFGTIDPVFVHEQTNGLLRPILTALAQEAAASPLWHDPMLGSFRLSFDILQLDFWSQPLGEQNLVFCVVQIAVQAHNLPVDELAFQQKPPLFIKIPKEKPGGRQTLKSLHAMATQQIWKVFQDHLLNLEPATSP